MLVDVNFLSKLNDWIRIDLVIESREYSSIVIFLVISVSEPQSRSISIASRCLVLEIRQLEIKYLSSHEMFLII